MKPQIINKLVGFTLNWYNVKYVTCLRYKIPRKISNQANVMQGSLSIFPWQPTVKKERKTCTFNSYKVNITGNFFYVIQELSNYLHNHPDEDSSVFNFKLINIDRNHTYMAIYGRVCFILLWGANKCAFVRCGMHISSPFLLCDNITFIMCPR